MEIKCKDPGFSKASALFTGNGVCIVFERQKLFGYAGQLEENPVTQLNSKQKETGFQKRKIKRMPNKDTLYMKVNNSDLRNCQYFQP